MITPLSETKQTALVHIYETAGLQVVYDIIEDLTIEIENELIGEDPANTASVLALQAVAHARRGILNKLIETVDYTVAEKRQVEKKDTVEARKNPKFSSN